MIAAFHASLERYADRPIRRRRMAGAGGMGEVYARMIRGSAATSRSKLIRRNRGQSRPLGCIGSSRKHGLLAS